MAANGISTLSTKQAKQAAKLAAAAIKRASTGRRSVLDITELPTQYSGNSIVDNSNAGGLVVGRPWISFTPIEPVVSLDAGNTSSYPGSGTTWTNLVDNTTYTINAGSYNSGNGGYISFNGFSTYVDIGNPISTNGNFTKEAWVSPQALIGTHVILGSYNNRLFFNNTNLQCTATGSNILLKTGVSTGWQHIVATFNDTTDTATLYINGVQVVQNTSTAHYTVTHAERIGSDTDSAGTTGTNFFGGKIAIARVYTDAISAAQVLSNFNAEKARFGL
jgi:hypothetical protein